MYSNTSKLVRNAILILVAATMPALLNSQAQPVVVTPLHTFSIKPANIRTLVMGKIDGKLYGISLPRETTQGFIFTLNRDGSGYEVLHNFTAQEWNGSGYLPGAGIPEPSLFQGNDGMLYGTTTTGGSNGLGSVFKLHPDGTGYSVLHHFTNSSDANPANLMQTADGVLYGSGLTLFRLNIDGSGYAVLHTFNNAEGSDPLSPLVQGNDGALYGTTYFGGPGTGGGNGSIFKINTNGANFTVLHTFGGTTAGDGKYPIAGLTIGSDGALYGTASIGGTNDLGTIFKINSDGSGYTNLHLFANSPDGALPYGGLAVGSGGVLFGTTYAGGKATQGSLFRINPDGNGYVQMYSFTNTAATGGQPPVGLVAGRFSNDVGVFYGGTYDGSPSAGSIFAVLVNPSLSITPVTAQNASNQTTIFWPAWALNYKLQSTTNLASPNWVSVTNGIPVTGVQVTSTNPSVFYRLVAP